MFDGTSSAYNNRKVIYSLGDVRLQINGLDEFRKFDIIYLVGSDIVLKLPQL